MAPKPVSEEDSQRLHEAIMQVIPPTEGLRYVAAVMVSLWVDENDEIHPKNVWSATDSLGQELTLFNIANTETALLLHERLEALILEVAGQEEEDEEALLIDEDGEDDDEDG